MNTRTVLYEIIFRIEIHYSWDKFFAVTNKTTLSAILVWHCSALNMRLSPKTNKQKRKYSTTSNNWDEFSVPLGVKFHTTSLKFNKIKMNVNFKNCKQLHKYTCALTTSSHTQRFQTTMFTLFLDTQLYFPTFPELLLINTFNTKYRRVIILEMEAIFWDNDHISSTTVRN
jgi:hypothetical protein